MSRIGVKPIDIPEGVTVKENKGKIEVSSDKGQIDIDLHKNIEVQVKDGMIYVTRNGETKELKSLHGLIRSLINNAVIGLTAGFQKDLEIVGVGYRASVSNDKLVLKVGYSHDVEIEIPEGIDIEVKKNIISVKGIDKQLVGQTAAIIRKVREPEPYKGKGIKYVDETINRKVGKAVKATAGLGA